MTKKFIGANILIKALVDNGVTNIFGYPGGAVLPIYDAIFGQNFLKHVLVRAEAGAVHAAEGYASADPSEQGLYLAVGLSSRKHAA